MILNLISGPRNISTALMYSFAQRDDTEVIDEPFYAHYLEETGADHPAKDEVLQAQSTDDKKVIEQLKEDAEKAPVLFIKNMAHHVDCIPSSFLAEVRNVFLVRNPREMLLSFIKTVPNPSLRDTAYQQQYRLFRYVTHTLRQAPIVIDAAELLKNPPVVLQAMCKKLDISFDDSMLFWEEGPIPEDGIWAEHWYGNVHKSMGFNPYSPKKEAVPERLESLLENCQNYYMRLYKHAIKAAG
jgi:hypothetical protein